MQHTNVGVKVEVQEFTWSRLNFKIQIALMNTMDKYNFTLRFNILFLKLLLDYYSSSQLIIYSRWFASIVCPSDNVN